MVFFELYTAKARVKHKAGGETSRIFYTNSTCSILAPCYCVTGKESTSQEGIERRLINIGIVFCWQRLKCQSTLKAKVPTLRRSRRLRHESRGRLVAALHGAWGEVKGKAVHPAAPSAGRKLLWWWRRC